MKFKPIYFYGAVAVLAVTVLIIVSQQNNSSNVTGDNTISNQNIPDDDIHSQLGGDNNPGKENVSEGFRHKMDVLKKAVEENPKDTLKLKEYADMLASAHMQKQSIEYYKKILSIDPGRTDIMFSLSFVYYNLGDFDNSRKQTERILEIEPNNGNAMYNLGAIAATSGDRVKAREIWQRLSVLYPDKEVGINAANSIKELDKLNN